MRVRGFVLLVLVLAIALAGCATVNVRPTPNDNAVVLTPLDKAKLASFSILTRYEAQLRDAAALEKLVLSKRASPGQVEVYRVKRKLLIKAKPLVETFDALVKGGTVPGPDKEQEINDVLNDLLAASSGLTSDLRDGLRQRSRESAEWPNMICAVEFPALTGRW